MDTLYTFMNDLEPVTLNVTCAGKYTMLTTDIRDTSKLSIFKVADIILHAFDLTKMPATAIKVTVKTDDDEIVIQVNEHNFMSFPEYEFPCNLLYRWIETDLLLEIAMGLRKWISNI